MLTEESDFNLNSQKRSPQVILVDFKRILFHAIRNWYWIVISLIIFLSIAYVRNRYAIRIYPVSASVIIKEAGETSGAELLYKNALLDPHRNYLNELYIIKSYPLIKQVIEDLNFEVSFYKEGNFLTTEDYGSLPVNVKIIDDHGLGSTTFHFQILSNNEYQLFALDEGDKSASQRSTFKFGQEIEYQGLKLSIDLTKDSEPELNSTFIFLYQSSALLVGSYVGGLSADWAEEGAGVINLSINGPTPKKDIDFLNGLIKHYQFYDLDKKNQTASRTIDFINDQLKDISDSLQQVEVMLENFKGKNIATNNSEEVHRLIEKLDGMEIQKTEFLIRTNYYHYLTKYINNSETLDPAIAPSSVGIQDPVLGSLISRMIDLQLQIKSFSGSNKIENPLTAGYARKLIELKKDITEAVRNLMETDKIKNSYLEKILIATESQLSSLPSSERKFISIKRNYSLLENLYVFLLQKKSEASISKASNTTDIIVVNPPMLSGSAISPQTSKNYAIAIFLGIAFPIMAFVLIEFLNTKIQSKEDIEKLIKIPFLGWIGHKKSMDSLVVLKNPKSAVAESFRALRTNLNYFLSGKDKPVIVVSSSIGGEGKTFTTINLGSVVAMTGKRTLIVGADMRRPKLFNDFNLSNDVGLSSYLANLATFKDVVQSTQQENLFLVSGGPVPPNPAELLLGDRIKTFLEEAKLSFDYIIIDTPPMALVTDSVSLAEFADHTIFIVRQNYTPRQSLSTLIDYYEGGRLTKVSLLLNDINKSGLGYGYGYGYEYGYGKTGNGYGYYSES